MPIDQKKLRKGMSHTEEFPDIFEEPEPIIPKRIRLDEVHHEFVHRYEVKG